MKKTILLSSILAAGLFMANSASAQFSARVNINTQPAWVPAYGDGYAENYYLPDVDAYYYAPRHQFVYNDCGNWVYANTLPPRYGNYDFYRGRRIVINEHMPWMHHNVYRERYAPYAYNRGGYDFRGGRDFHGDRGYGRRGRW